MKSSAARSRLKWPPTSWLSIVSVTLKRVTISPARGDWPITKWFFDHFADAHVDYDIIPSVIYTSPEVAWVGLTEDQVKASGRSYKLGRFPFSANSRAKLQHEDDGFVKVISSTDDYRILGVHMIGYNVTELIAEIVVARKLETTGHEIIKSVHPHPTMSEAIMEAAAAAYGEVIHL